MDYFIVLSILFANYCFWYSVDALNQTYQAILYRLNVNYKNDALVFFIAHSIISIIFFYSIILADQVGLNRNLIIQLIGLLTVLAAVFKLTKKGRFKIEKQFRPLFLFSNLVFVLFLLKVKSPDFYNVAASTWFSGNLASDNILPWFFVKGLMEQSSGVVTPLLETWLSSDRPPIMAATGLSFVAWTSLIPDELFVFSDLRGELVSNLFFVASVNLNCLIIVPFLKLSDMKNGNRRHLQLLLLLACTPFVLVNLVYTWPKMMAAFFLLSALVYHFEKKKRFSRDMLYFIVPHSWQYYLYDHSNYLIRNFF